MDAEHSRTGVDQPDKEERVQNFRKSKLACSANLGKRVRGISLRFPQLLWEPTLMRISPLGASLS